MEYLKMGAGPLYVFYNPYVLPHLEVPLTAARAVLLGEASIAPLGAPVCDVVAVAKRDLQAGEVLDGLGGFATYGLIENADIARAGRLLPVGLSEGCRIVRDINRDEAISYDDVELPAGRLADRLRADQNQYFDAVVRNPTQEIQSLPRGGAKSEIQNSKTGYRGISKAQRSGQITKSLS
jgi:predicted homoserine dehydrogenase-like protein